MSWLYLPFGLFYSSISICMSLFDLCAIYWFVSFLWWVLAHKNNSIYIMCLVHLHLQSRKKLIDAVIFSLWLRRQYSETYPYRVDEICMSKKKNRRSCWYLYIRFWPIRIRFLFFIIYTSILDVAKLPKKIILQLSFT